jgi:hypothetical protein
MSNTKKVRQEFERMLEESKFYLNASLNEEYEKKVKKIEDESYLFSELEKYEHVPFLNLYYDYKCNKLSKELYTILCEIHSSLGEKKWNLTEDFIKCVQYKS